MSFVLGNLPKGPVFGPGKDTICHPYDMPYAPFNPQEKLGRAADWISQEDQGQHYHQHPHQQRGTQNQQRGTQNTQRGTQNTQRGMQNTQRGMQTQRGARVGTRNDRSGDVNESTFGFKQEYDESSFATVDASGRTAAVVVPTPALLAGRGGSTAGGRSNATRGGSSGGTGMGRPGQGGNFNRSGGQAPRSGNSMRSHHGNHNSRGGYGGYRGGNQFQQRVVRESSLQVNEEWPVAAELDLPRINKHGAMDQVPQPQVLEIVGSLGTYSKQYDRVSTKNEQPLQVSDRSNAKSLNPSTMEDPIMLNLINTTQESAKLPTIFATDSILSQIMSAPRTIYSWDLIITRLGDNVVVLDKRPGVLDLASVNENAQEPPQDHPTDKDFVNNPSNLAIEATYVVANYSQQVLEHTKRTSMGSETPFHESVSEEEKPSAAFIYKKWQFNELMDVIVRTEVDAVTEVQGKSMMVTIRALNQAPGLPGQKLDWRKSLDTQRGAVMAMEMRNNWYKLSRWITQALLAETDQMKLGFVARSSPRDVSRHTILGLSTYKPSEFASQLNVSMAHGFGILYAVTEAAIQQPPGKYVLLKDPNKPMLRLYAVTMEPLAQGFVVGAQDPFGDLAAVVEDETMVSDVEH